MTQAGAILAALLQERPALFEADASCAVEYTLRIGMD